MPIFQFFSRFIYSLLFIVLIFASPAFAQMASQSVSNVPHNSAISPELSSQVKTLIGSDKPRLETIFKDIHQNPELAFMENRTASIVAKQLQNLGFEVKTGIAKTGVVGILRNGTGPVVMYRADMDANAVEEKTGVPYASSVRVKKPDGSEVPAAHMCGHDAHITWMLGAAKAMVALKDKWSGTLVLLAQPAEEVVLGAVAMVKDGLYTKYAVPVPNYLIGVHTRPLPTGTVVSAEGVRLAGTDQIDVVFRGVGTHGSTPHLGKDPIVMAALAIIQYQTIVSRMIDPLETAVVTVGAIQAGNENNVIPDTALLKLNLRFFNIKVREQMIQAIRNINNNIARSYGVPEDKMPTMTMKGHSLPLANDKALIEHLNQTLKNNFGEKLLTTLPVSTGSEDFHMLKGQYTQIPNAFLWVGIADPLVYEQARREGKPYPFSAHGSFYKVDLNSISFGAQVATLMMLDLLAKP